MTESTIDIIGKFMSIKIIASIVACYVWWESSVLLNDRVAYSLSNSIDTKPFGNTDYILAVTQFDIYTNLTKLSIVPLILFLAALWNKRAIS